MSPTNSNNVSVRYMIDDVDAAVAFYTNHLGFHLERDAAPAFASVVRGNLRLLLAARRAPVASPWLTGRSPFQAVGIGFTWKSLTSTRKSRDFVLPE
jgi:catechol 2,3-dioxygenase-like lactoylglutathione lyase family enzyme